MWNLGVLVKSYPGVEVIDAHSDHITRVRHIALLKDCDYDISCGITKLDFICDS